MANEHDKQHGQVTIHIDTKTYESPSPTTGAALYVLGGIKPGFVLFKEIHGHGDDPQIKNDATPVTLQHGDHFYSAKDELNPGQ
jgi:hypothetical protein